MSMKRATPDNPRPPAAPEEPAVELALMETPVLEGCPNGETGEELLEPQRSPVQPPLSWFSGDGLASTESTSAAVTAARREAVTAA
jgi:hypothetical protein